MSIMPLPLARRRVLRELPDIAFCEQCGALARPVMIIGGRANAPMVSCVLHRGHEGQHVGAVRARRRLFGKPRGWSCYVWQTPRASV